MVFGTLYPIILGALAIHFLGNILTGRAKRRFVKWEWPHHEGSPIPFLPKFLHFQHVASMIILAVTGMYIRFINEFPWQGGWVRYGLRYLHYIAMVIVTINLVWRLWYAFYAKRRDYREFAITKEDIVTAPKVIMYYAFIKPSKPHLAKYNVMQKMTYTLFAPLLVLQAVTGFALLTQEFVFGYSPRDVLIGWWLGALVGSTDLAGWIARTVHYIINWLFIVLTTIHVYLSVTEDFPAFLNFFGLTFLDRGHAHAEGGHDEHGHGDEDSSHGHGSVPVLSEAEQA